MKTFLNLNIALFLLCLLIVVELTFLFLGEMDLGMIYYVVNGISQIVNGYVFVFLFLYATRVKSQKISTIATVMILSVFIFNLITLFYPVTFNREGMSQSDITTRQLLIQFIPSMIFILARIIIAIQFIKNSSEGISNRNLKWLGYSYLLTMLLLWLLPLSVAIINEYWISHANTISALLTMLPHFALINFFYHERNLLNVKEGLSL